ncbi:MAG: hypothetical protein MUC56_09820 [Thermoanaerobaculales bacterium]|jgi:hypothetical protein|nr:hypothetical protein [Thermoanaerobaculales bacterium]
MRLRAAIAAASVVAGGLVAAAQAPTAVAERTSVYLGRTTRVSLYSNHVVVVSIRSETDDFVHRTTLDYDEYMVYLQALDRLAAEIGDQPVSSDVSSRDAESRLTLHIGPGAPRTFSYSPLAALDLALGKIAALMDDLETRALATPAGEHELRAWSPAIGECVGLRHGGEACVTAVSDDGTIELTVEETGLAITVPVESRVEVILAAPGSPR